MTGYDGEIWPTMSDRRGRVWKFGDRWYRTKFGLEKSWGSIILYIFAEIYWTCKYQKEPENWKFQCCQHLCLTVSLNISYAKLHLISHSYVLSSCVHHLIWATYSNHISYHKYIYIYTSYIIYTIYIYTIYILYINIPYIYTIYHIYIYQMIFHMCSSSI